MNTERIFLIVLDSLGAGAAPDAADFGDAGASTLGSISKSLKFNIPNLKKLGIGNIDGLDFIGTTASPTAAVARMREASKGKDTTIGHWEISGIISETPLPTFPNGFPDEIIEKFEKETGRRVICNKPYSGTDVIRDFGREQLKTGALIVYTSADSVFQIAAHEDLIPCEELYRYCRIARKLLCGKYAVGRVIARPFTGEYPFTRTANRHDFSLEPYGRTMLDAISEAGLDSIAVGKITDIFAGRGVTETLLSHSNDEGMRLTYEVAKRDFHGICFTNLVDFDMVYGHRNNVDGYANALSEFDAWLPDFIAGLRDGDVVILTADHGCDPGDISTDHTREYTPMIAFGKSVAPVNLGTRNTFADISATVCELLKVKFDSPGKSFAEAITLNNGN